MIYISMSYIKMEIPENIKNRIINLTLYTRTTAKRIINIVSTDEIKITIEDYYKILDEYSKKTGEPITKGNTLKIELKEIEDSMLIELYEKGLKNYQMLNYLLDNGYIISPNELTDRLCTLRKNNQTDGKRITIKNKSEFRPNDTDKKVLELYEKNYTYADIAKYLETKGISITPQGARTMIFKIYSKQGKEMPKRAPRRKNNTDEKNIVVKIVGKKEYETIFNLREQKYTYKQIAEYFNEEGYKVSVSTIGNICRKIYKEKGLEQPEIVKRKPDAINEEIFELAEQGMTYAEIEKYYKEKGILISKANIAARCINTYKRRKIKKGKMDNYMKSKIYSERIKDVELIKLYFGEDMTCEEIKEYYSQKGINPCSMYIQKRIKKIKREIGADNKKRNKEKTDQSVKENEDIETNTKTNTDIDIRTIDESKVNKILLNLKNTRNATDDQLKKLAKYYGMDFKEEAVKYSPYNVLKEDR